MIEHIHHTHNAYPPLLKEIQNPPSKLFILGTMPDISNTFISIVGTRKATREGLSIARSFARELSVYGCVIVSGLALGIDAAAHEGALDARGKTIAVLANGLDSIYPRQHEQLAKRIVDSGGCIISEYPENTPPYPNQFLERNRIVAGVSYATIVVEAPIRSGSIATARLAIESGREVFVVPGPIYNKNYEGSHALLRNGARLVSNTKDILDDLQIEIKNKSMTYKTDETSEKVIEAIKTSSKPLRVDTIIEITHLEPSRVQEILTLLVLDGIIDDIGGVFTLNK
jgi:DNA processing protein